MPIDTSTSSTAPARVAQNFFAALNERRWKDLPRYLAPNVIDHNKVIYGEPDAPGAAIAAFRQQFEAFDDGGMFPVQTITENETVAVRLIARGRHVGAHPRMPAPTGRRFEVEQIWIFTVQDGLITEIRGVSDRLTMFLQLGWDWPEAE